MTAGDVQLTRGVSTRDDLLTIDPAIWLLDSGVTMTTDGDLATVAGVTTTNGAAYAPGTPIGISSTTYGFVAVRAAITSGSGNFQIVITFSDVSTQTIPFTLSANLQFFVGSITSGKTINSYKITSSTGTSTYLVDFIYFFKERLTLPAVSEPLQLPLSRYLVELAIPNREGGIVQDLGSSSPQVEVAGRLITTTTPNNYTGDQWWDVLVGVWLEANWQWFTSDRVSYKYQVQELTPVQNPGQVGYYGFKMRLRKIDVLSATAQTFASNTGTGTIQ